MIKKIALTFSAATVVVAVAVIVLASGFGPANAAPPAAPTASSSSQLAPMTGNGKIAVVKDGNVTVVKSGSSRAITSGLRYSHPTWSPDGTQIAAAVIGTNHSDIVLLDETGKKVRQLTYNLSNIAVGECIWARSPAWSPDGSTIAYATDVGTTHLRLYTVPTNSPGSIRQIGTPSDAGDVDYPAYSPDGTKIAATGFNLQMGQIYVYETKTYQWKKLTDLPEGAMMPAWSPDGSKIAFVAKTGSTSDVWVMNADGSGATKVTNEGQAATPTWSPDGKQIAFVGGRSFDLRAFTYNPGSEPNLKTMSNGRMDGPSGASWAR